MVHLYGMTFTRKHDSCQASISKKLMERMSDERKTETMGLFSFLFSYFVQNGKFNKSIARTVRRTLSDSLQESGVQYEDAENMLNELETVNWELEPFVDNTPTPSIGSIYKG